MCCCWLNWKSLIALGHTGHLTSAKCIIPVVPDQPAMVNVCYPFNLQAELLLIDHCLFVDSSKVQLGFINKVQHSLARRHFAVSAKACSLLSFLVAWVRLPFCFLVICVSIWHMPQQANGDGTHSGPFVRQTANGCWLFVQLTTADSQ